MTENHPKPRVIWGVPAKYSPGPNEIALIKRIAYDAAFRDGYDEVIVRSDIHATTGTKRKIRPDEWHITADFVSTVWRGSSQTAHIKLHQVVPDGSDTPTYIEPHRSRNDATYPFHHIYQKGKTSYKAPIFVKPDIGRRKFTPKELWQMSGASG